MRLLIVIGLLAGIVSIGWVGVQAADEQRQAYDKMVEESVKEADDYVQQKQSEAAQKHVQQQEAARRREQAAARAAETKEEKKTIPGVHIRSRPHYPEPAVEAVPLPSGPVSGGEGGAVAPAAEAAAPVAN